MKNKQEIISDLIVSIAGVALFLSVNHWIDLNGFNDYSLFLALAGVLLLFFSDKLPKIFHSNFLTKNVVISLAHIMVFLGIKNTLSIYISDYLVLFIIISMVMLSYSKSIAGFFVGER